MHSSRMRTTRSSSCLLGGCLPQCMLRSAQVWAWIPLPWRTARHAGIPPLQRPARHAGIPPPPPWRPARHAGIPPPPPGDLQGMLGYQLQCMPPPCTEFLTHVTENITLPQTSFAGGNETGLISMQARINFMEILPSSASIRTHTNFS